MALQHSGDSRLRVKKDQAKPNGSNKAAAIANPEPKQKQTVRMPASLVGCQEHVTKPEPKPKQNRVQAGIEYNENLGRIRREKIGVINIARRVHVVLKRDVFHQNKMLSDVKFLQEKLSNWQDDGTYFGKVTRQLVEAAIAEAAVDPRLTSPLKI